MANIKSSKKGIKVIAKKTEANHDYKARVKNTIKECDRILVLDKGRIIEQGNHESLIEQKGKYYEMLKIQ